MQRAQARHLQTEKASGRLARMKRLLPRLLIFDALLALPFFALGAVPNSPWEMTVEMEHWLVSGNGVRFPVGLNAPARDNSYVFVDGTWPAAFQSRVGEVVVLRVSPDTGCYEFEDSNGAVFWTVVPFAPITWDWISPFRSPFRPDTENLYSPFRLAREWRLTTPEIESYRVTSARSSPRRTAVFSPVTNLCFTAFAITNEVLFFTADWPANDSLPDNLLDVWCSTNLASKTWAWISSVTATNPPVSFALSQQIVPGYGSALFVHGPSCGVETNVVTSPLDGTTVYTNVVWLCNHADNDETGFFQLGTRNDNDGDGIPDTWETFVHHTDPELFDTDDDGLTDGEELALGTDPLDLDSDGDTMPDGWEIENNLDPLDYSDSLLDPDSDGLVNVYEFHAETDPAVPDYDQAYKLVVGRDGEALTLEEAFRDSWPYAILEIQPGIYEGPKWTDLYVPKHPILVTSRHGGRSRSVVLRTSGNPLSAFFFDAEQGPHTMFQGLDVELNGGQGYQSAFWLGDGNVYSGTGASAFFRNVHVRLGAAPHVSMGWRCRHFTSRPTILANCSVDAAGTEDAIGVYAVDSPELVLENCSFLHFPDVNLGISYGVETESTAGNFGGAPDPIPVLLRNVLFDESFTNAFAVAPLETGVRYRTILQNCIFPSDLPFPVSATNASVVAPPLCDRTGHLATNSPAIDGGVPVVYAVSDFDGEMRMGTPDVGADEYASSSDVDSDEDGLSNSSELQIHGTDPFRFDSDSDGVSDGDEIAEGTDPLNDASVCFVLSGLLSGDYPEAAGAKLAIASTNDATVTLYSPVLPIAGTNVTFAFSHLSVTNVSERLLCLFYDLDSDDVPDETESKQFERFALNGHETHLTTAFHVLTATSDLDGDGIPDLWELVHGLSNTNSVDAFEDWDDDGLINLHEYWMACNPEVADGTNSLLAIISQSVDSRLLGKDPASSLRFFQSYPALNVSRITNSLTANSDCWAAELDFSCESPWNSVAQNRKSGTLISPIHILLTKHHQNSTPLPLGSKFYFRNSEGQVFERILTGTNRIDSLPDTDLLVGMLDTPLPSSVSVAKILPPNYRNYLKSGAGLPALSLDQESKILVSDIKNLHSGGGSNVVMVTNKRPVSPIRSPFYEVLVAGDSSNPKFLLIGDSLVLLSIHWQAGHEGASICEYADLVNEAMNQLTPGAGYELQVFDFSDYTPLPFP